MANREENLKKINEELEKLSDEELDQVAGGNSGHTSADSKLMKLLKWLKEKKNFKKPMLSSNS